MYTRHIPNPRYAPVSTQVFHICEGGKKISFLCPNGTIFQQTDLICDWWFRVNCDSSPDYYAESSEILTRSKNQHIPTFIGDAGAGNNNNTKQQNHKTPVINAFAGLVPGVVGNNNSSNANGSGGIGGIGVGRGGGGDNRGMPRAGGDGGNVNDVRGQPSVGITPFSSLFEVADMAKKVAKTKERNANNSRTAAASRKLAPSAASGGSSNVPSSFNPADLLETQEVAETASFARSNHQQHGARNSFLQQPIYVRSFQVANETTITHNSAHHNGTENIKTNYNIINYLQSSRSSSSSSVRSVNHATHHRPTTSFAAQSVEPIYHRGTILYAGSQATKTLQQKDAAQQSYTTPNQIQFTDPNPKSAKTPRRLQKMRSTQYYTPTVPTILARATTRALDQSTAGQDEEHSGERSKPTTQTTVTPSDHAIEMMRILNELMVGNRQLKDTARNRKDDGRSLALYFATGEDNSVVNDVPFATVKLDLDTPNHLDAVAVSNVTHISGSLLSNATIYKYDKLFATKTNDENQAAASVHAGFHAEAQASDVAPQNGSGDFDASNDVLTGGDTTPAIRSLAQVFTHALSAYLHDPTTFRQVLSEIRPTEPPARKQLNSRRTERFFQNGPQATANTFVTNPEELEVLDFSDVTVSTQQNEANFPSTTPQTPTGHPFEGDQVTTDTPAVHVPKYSIRPSVHFVATADHVPASRLLTDNLEKNAHTTRKQKLAARRNPLALEINGAFIASTTFPYFQDDSAEQMRKDVYGAAATTQRYPTTYAAATTTISLHYPTTTDLPATVFENETPGSLLESEFNLPLPNLEPLNLDDNDLQRSASASFVAAGGHQLLHNRLDAHVNQVRSTTSAPPPVAQQQRSDQRSTLAYTVFLDPLTINDELLHSASAVTPSLHTYLPRSTTAYGDVSSAGTTEPSTAATVVPPFADSHRRGKFHHGDATHSPQVDTATTAADVQYMDMMQERANEMFGGLNNTSAAHLMNVMRKANKNKTVRKLILLLIQTCDEDYSTTVEQSRSALLNALIGMDSSGKFNDSIDVKVISPLKLRRGKSNDGGVVDEQPAESKPTTIVRATTTVATPTTGASRPTVGEWANDDTTTPAANERWYDKTTTTVQDPFDYATESSALFATGFDMFANIGGIGQDDGLLPSDRPWTTTYPPASFDDQQQATTTAVPSDVESEEASAGRTTTAQPWTTSTTTTKPTTTTASTKTTRPVSRGSTRHHQARRIAKDLDELLVAEGSQSYDPARFRSLAAAGSADAGNQRSDTRALDLLRSLYTLAGKLGK